MMSDPPRPAPELLDRRLWRRHYFIPTEHGAWIWWIGPFLIGTAAGGTLGLDALVLLLAVAAVFFMRQPAAITVKVLSGRRVRSDLAPGLFWSSAYSLIALLAVLVLIRSSHAQLLWLAIPGVLVFAWHLWLVSRREERGQRGIELVAAGVLALAAPAAYWVAGGTDTVTAWLLWLLSWLQSAASIVFIYMRLEQRRLPAMPAPGERWRTGARTLVYHAFNFVAAAGLAALRLVPALVPAAFALMLADALEGVAHPPVGVRPAAIGLRQLGASAAFAALMIAAYLAW
jgi:hypothetical protein